MPFNIPNFTLKQVYTMHMKLDDSKAIVLDKLGIMLLDMFANNIVLIAQFIITLSISQIASKCSDTWTLVNINPLFTLDLSNCRPMLSFICKLSQTIVEHFI